MMGHEIKFKQKVKKYWEQKNRSISEPPRPVENSLQSAQRSINLILGILELYKRKKKIKGNS